MHSNIKNKSRIKIHRRSIYILVFILSLLLCWSDKTNIFFTTFVPVILLLKMFFCIKNNKVRVFSIVTLLLSNFIIGFIYLYYGSLSTSMVMSSFGVGITESISMISTFGTGFLFFILVVLFLSSVITIKSKRAMYSRNTVLTLMFMFLLSLIKPIADGINAWGGVFYLNNVEYKPTFISQPYLDQYKSVVGAVISASSILTESVIDKIKYKKIAHDEYPSYIRRSSIPYGEDNIVYIIGESSNPGRYGAYGYSKNTTPNISSLVHRDELFLIKNVHSPAAQTRLAVPMLTSFVSPRNLENLFKYKNLLEMAKIQGYETFWFDSQEQDGLWDKTFGYISQYADILQSPNKNNSGFPVQIANDDELMPAIEHYFNSQAKKKLYVIHIMGSHMPYSSRRGNSLFKDDYDASIFHTDEIIGNIIKLANEKLQNYKLIYVPDHGEVVGHGHGFPTRDNEMYQIPMITNSKVIEEKISSYKDSNGYFSSDLTKYIILWMMGFEVDCKYKQHLIDDSNMILDEKESLIDFYALRNVKLY